MTTSPRTVPRPRELGGSDLILSHFSLDRNHPVDDRISAAGAAGFAGIGFFAGQYQQLTADGWSPGRFHELLDAAGICLAEVEVLSGWATASPSEAYRAFENVVWTMVDEFEARYVQAIGPHDGSLSDAARWFGELCDRAADHGAVIGLEFLPFTNIVDAGDALRIVEEAARPNGGVCVDIWHHARGANDIDLIRAIPGELITGIQMSDGTTQPAATDGEFDYRDDCLRHRVAPGTGEFGAVDFVATLLDLGVEVPWSLEVCNDDVWGAPGGPHVQRIADGMRAVLAAARDSPDTPGPPTV